MRQRFGQLLADTMCQDQRVWCLSGDLGFGVLNPVREQAPERFCNTGAAEQLMLGAAVGLAHNGYIPICYSITPFVIFRPYEWLRNYLDHEQTPVKLVGAGRDRDYGDLGFSHWAEDDRRAMSVFQNIPGWWPDSEAELIDGFQNWLYNDKPGYLNLRRTV